MSLGVWLRYVENGKCKGLLLVVSLLYADGIIFGCKIVSYAWEWRNKTWTNKMGMYRVTPIYIICRIGG